jgi:hypothetical protein
MRLSKQQHDSGPLQHAFHGVWARMFVVANSDTHWQKYKDSRDGETLAISRLISAATQRASITRRQYPAAPYSAAYFARTLRRISSSPA